MLRSTGFLCVMVSACSATNDTPPTKPNPPSAAEALARTFAPDLVGKITPEDVVAGTYAMALAMSFDAMPTMDAHIMESRSGAMQMMLAVDGTAQACLGSRKHDATHGQYEYQPPERTQHRESEEVQLVALAGRWTLVDRIATIRFDRLSWGTCDLGKSTRLPEPFAELRCIGVGPTDRVPARSLACEASERSQLLGLGMPMTEASRRVSAPLPPMRPVPAGRNVVLTAPGVAVAVTQDSHAAVPTITFRAGTTTLVEADYQKKPSSDPPRR